MHPYPRQDAPSPRQAAYIRNPNVADTETTASSFAARPTSGAAARLYERVVEILSDQIRRGEISGETRLTESSVAKQFGVSRAPARRALAELAASGLLRKSGGRGYHVRPAAGGKAAGSQAVEWAGTQLVPALSWEPIYARVEEEIIGRISFASWRVNEAELARHYGVSRTVARDVVARLQQRGLILKDTRSRWFAPELTPEHVGQLYELRALLEPAALERAATKLPPGLLPRLRANLEKALAHPEKTDGPTLDALEEELHVSLLSHCGNRALMDAITAPQSLLIAHRFLYRWTPRLFASEPFLPEHLSIVEWLEHNEVQKAAKALERHLRDSRDRALARVEVIRQAFEPESLAWLDRLDLG